jgi:hypothetical protein
MCVLAIGGMPVLAVALFLAPINAAIYGIAGAVIGWILGGVRANFGKIITTSLSE